MTARVVPVIVSTNYKGGVGKTTTSRVLAQGIAENPKFNKGKPVLVIDLDPQANTTRRWNLTQILPSGDVIPKSHPALAGQDVPYSSVCDLWLSLLGMGASVEPEPYETSNPMIHVVPAHEELMSNAMYIPREEHPKLGALMKQWLRSPALAEKYCCVIIDTQPSKSPLIDAALAAATHGYIPFTPEPQAVEGVLSMITYFTRFSERRSANEAPLRLIGLLPNMVRKTTLHAIYISALKKQPVYGKYMMNVYIADRIGYAETDSSRNTPGSVTQVAGSNIAFEARRFVGALWEEVCKDLPALGWKESA